MALHWQPPHGDPVAEFSPEPVSSTAPGATPAGAASTAVDRIAGAVVIDAILLAVTGVAIGAILFALYSALR